jgi:hypothetical protein
MQAAIVVELSVRRHQYSRTAPQLNHGLLADGSGGASPCHFISDVGALDKIPSGDAEDRS